MLDFINVKYAINVIYDIYLEALSINFSKMYNTWGLSVEMTLDYVKIGIISTLSYNLAILHGSVLCYQHQHILMRSIK